jgi:hypothetical protein
LVVTVGLTFKEVPATVPRPEMFRVGIPAPPTVQMSVVVCPGDILFGVAENLLIIGAAPMTTVTVAVCDPKTLAAVRV